MKYFLFIFIAVVFLSCEKKEEEVPVPSHVLQKEEYAKLLADFTLAEAAGNTNVKNLSGPKFDSAYYFNPLKENKITQAQYDSTLSFYSKHPALYKEVCEMVLNMLNNMKTARAGKDSAAAAQAQQKK
jgi:hypothetical protein